MISAKEKALIHIYAAAAELQEAEYRQMLREHTGFSSCADAEFSHHHCDVALAMLEACLFARVAEGAVPDPRGYSKHIRDEFYFRSKLSPHGKINARQFRLINNLYNQLSEFVEDARADRGYLCAIIVKSVGRSVAIHNLSSAQAGMVINALRDRFDYAMRTANQKNSESLVPF